MIDFFHFSHRAQSRSSRPSSRTFARSACSSSFRPIPVHRERDRRHRSNAGATSGVVSDGEEVTAVGFDGPASAMLRLWYWIVKVERLDLGSENPLLVFAGRLLPPG